MKVVLLTVAGAVAAVLTKFGLLYRREYMRVKNRRNRFFEMSKKREI